MRIGPAAALRRHGLRKRDVYSHIDAARRGRDLTVLARSLFWWRTAIVTASLALGMMAAGRLAAEPLEGRLQVIKERAALRIAYRTDSPPFSFLDPTEGRPVGYTIELCGRIAKSIEAALGLKSLAIQWVPVNGQTRFDAIVSGAADMECGSTTVSLSRLRRVDFSNLVFAESTGVLVRPNIGINRFEDMAGKRIGVVPGSTNARAVRDQIARRKLDVTVVEFRDREEGVAALARGQLEGFATDKSVLLSLAEAAKARELTLLPEDLSFEPFAIMLPRGDADFRLAVNTGLAHVFRSGDIIEIYTKYFSGAAPHPSVWLGAVFTFGALPE
jgi:glutamate/aspartate transport system substrate-binding protein